MNCNICDSEIEEDNGDIVGQFGISQVAFMVCFFYDRYGNTITRF